MATSNELMAVGFAALAAPVVAGGTYAALTGAGTTTADAATIKSTIVYATGANNSGIKLKTGVVGDTYHILNASANTLKLYPPTGGKLNDGSSDAEISITTKKAVTAVAISNNSYMVIVGA